jgi:hypothetical protein
LLGRELSHRNYVLREKVFRFKAFDVVERAGCTMLAVVPVFAKTNVSHHFFTYPAVAVGLLPKNLDPRILVPIPH